MSLTRKNVSLTRKKMCVVKKCVVNAESDDVGRALDNWQLTWGGPAAYLRGARFWMLALFLRGEGIDALFPPLVGAESRKRKRRRRIGRHGWLLLAQVWAHQSAQAPRQQRLRCRIRLPRQRFHSLLQQSSRSQEGKLLKLLSCLSRNIRIHFRKCSY